VLHPETRAFIGLWEPPGRDRITLLRHDAERYGPRAPCKWHHLAILDRALGNESAAHADESRAKGVTRDRCSRFMF